MRALVSSLIVALALTGPALAADPIPPAIARIVAGTALPNESEWVFAADGDVGIDYLRFPFVRTPNGAASVVFRVFVDPVTLLNGEMEVAVMARVADCKARTIRAAGSAGFDKDGKYLASSSAEDAYKTPADKSVDAEFIKMLCDPAYKPKEDELMSLGDAWDDGVDTIMFSALDDLPTEPAPKK